MKKNSVVLSKKNWDYCKLDELYYPDVDLDIENTPQSCIWSQLYLPEPRSSVGSGRSEDGIRIFHTQFEFSDFCGPNHLSGYTRCFLVFSEAARMRVVINGNIVGYFGSDAPGSEYTYLLPPKFDVTNFLSSKKINDITVVVHSVAGTRGSLSKSPIAIVPENISMLLQGSQIVEIAVAPLLSALILAVLGIVLLFLTTDIYLFYRYKWLFLYFLASIFFLVSYSRVPRAFISPLWGEVIHAFLHLMLGSSLLLLLRALNVKLKMGYSVPIGVLGLMALILFILVVIRATGVGPSLTVYKYCYSINIFLSLLIWMYLFFNFILFLNYLFKNSFTLSDKRFFGLLLTFSSALFIALIFDVLMFLGFFEEHYSSRITLAYWGLVFGALNIRDLVSARRTDLAFGKLNQDIAKILHDLKPVPANLRLVSTQMSQSDPELVELLTSISDRVSDSIGKINAKIKEVRSSLGSSSSFVPSMKGVQLQYVLPLVKQVYLEHLSHLDLGQKVSIDCSSLGGAPEKKSLRILEQDFQRLIENLILNSIEAEATSISISVAVVSSFFKRERLQFIFLDNGVGLTDEQIYSFRSRGQIASTKENGSSTGMQIILDLVSNAGGSIRVQSLSSSVKGVEIVIELPLQSR